MLPFLMGIAAALLAALVAAKLREDRTEVRGVADVLPYGFLVAPGVVLNKDGSLLAGFRFRGPDSAAATADDLADLQRSIALDAVSRGLTVLAVDAHDLAFGTSRWSSKLVHGGLRYLEMMDYRRVAEKEAPSFQATVSLGAEKLGGGQFAGRILRLDVSVGPEREFDIDANVRVRLGGLLRGIFLEEMLLEPADGKRLRGAGRTRLGRGLRALLFAGLGLPLDYEWGGRSKSGAGLHVQRSSAGGHGPDRGAGHAARRPPARPRAPPGRG